jgi:hypothetical protein
VLGEEVRLDDNKIHIFGARRANVTDLVHESPAPRNWHCQCPLKALLSNPRVIWGMPVYEVKTLRAIERRIA